MNRWIAISLLLLVAGCRNSTKPTTAPIADTVQMTIGNETFTVEIADDAEEQEHGLMERTFMPPDHGMIFVFPNARHRQFWMKNTRIPLDIIYIDETGRIVSIKSMKPLDETHVTSDGPAMYAIELNQGAALRIGINPGDIITIPTVILDRQSRK
jgi:uncharacterized membrane protein (UPF0127 family)